MARKWLSGKASVLKTEVPYLVRGSSPLLRVSNFYLPDLVLSNFVFSGIAKW